LTLKNISNNELLLVTKKLASDERELLLDILHHLEEIESRKLFLEIGFASLWAYCTKELLYSEASAQRRIEAMRALREIPSLGEKIRSGSLTLSNIAKTQSVIRKSNSNIRKENLNNSTLKENNIINQSGALPNVPIVQPIIHTNTVDTNQKLKILLQLENKTQKEAEIILAKYFPEEIKPCEKVKSLTSELVEIKLTASRELTNKLEKVKQLFSHKNPNPNLSETLEMMADFVISKKDPMVKNNNQSKAQQKLCSPDEEKNLITPPQRKYLQEYRSLRPRSLSTRKHIPSATRRQVWQNANGSCEYTDQQSGRRCESRHQLELEHIQPVAFGGGNKITNLKLFCKAHNLHAAREATLI
jgi:5-methylcytosine-specific restriction endonuclease McrA